MCAMLSTVVLSDQQVYAVKCLALQLRCPAQ